MHQPNIPIMTAVSMGANASSIAVTMEQEQMCAIQAVWTGSPVGDFTIETSCDDGSIDPSTGLASGITNWVTYTGSTVAAGGSTGTFIWRTADIPDKWIRLKYTRTSGTGSVDARLMAKGE